MLIIKYPVPTNVKELRVSLLYFSSNPRDSLTFSPDPFTYRQWISRNPPYVSSFDSNV